MECNPFSIISVRREIYRKLKDMHHGFDKGCVEGSRDLAERDETYALVITTLQDTFQV